jgi:hypothetical protein
MPDISAMSWLAGRYKRVEAHHQALGLVRLEQIQKATVRHLFELLALCGMLAGYLFDNTSGNQNGASGGAEQEF